MTDYLNEHNITLRANTPSQIQRLVAGSIYSKHFQLSDHHTAIHHPVSPAAASSSIAPSSSSAVTMVLNEERECAVCFQKYSRSSRIPRILHCNHTFCTPCLDIMFRLQSGISTISCPMCRWITCTRVSLGMSGSLWVNTQIWDQIAEEQQHEDEEEFITNQTEQQLATETPASRHSGFKSKLLRKIFSCVYLQGHPGES